MLDFGQIQGVATRGFLPLLLGFICQMILLSRYHRIRPVAIVFLRTSIVQFCALMGAGLLAQKWPFPFEKEMGLLYLPLAMLEGAIVIWYLLWPRPYKI